MTERRVPTQVQFVGSVGLLGLLPGVWTKGCLRIEADSMAAAALKADLSVGMTCGNRVLPDFQVAQQIRVCPFGQLSCSGTLPGNSASSLLDSSAGSPYC